MKKTIELFYVKSFFIKVIFWCSLLTSTSIYYLLSESTQSSTSTYFIFRLKYVDLLARFSFILILIFSIYFLIFISTKFLTRSPFMRINEVGLDNGYGFHKHYFVEWSDIHYITFDSKSSFKNVLIVVATSKSNKNVNWHIPSSTYSALEFKSDFLDTFKEEIDMNCIEIRYAD